MKILKKFKLNNDALIKQDAFIMDRVSFSWLKKIIFGFMGGAFIALGYIGYIIITAIDPGVNNPGLAGVLKFLGAAVFPVGILLCIFLGGNLFTSNVLIYLGVMKKKVKYKTFFTDLAITWLFNGIGGLTIAAIAWGAGIFSIDNSLLVNNDANSWFNGVLASPNAAGMQALNIAETKINNVWWSTLLSGILCNMLVCGGVFCFLVVDSKALGTFLVYIIILLFALTGFHHVVANFFVISEGGFASIANKTPWDSNQVGKIFYQNLIPSSVGNLLGGMMIPFVYMICSSSNSNKGVRTISDSNIITKCETKIDNKFNSSSMSTFPKTKKITQVEKPKLKKVNGIEVTKKHIVIKSTEIQKYNYDKRRKQWHANAGFNEKSLKCSDCKNPKHASVLTDTNKHICYSCFIKKVNIIKKKSSSKKK